MERYEGIIRPANRRKWAAVKCTANVVPLGPDHFRKFVARQSMNLIMPREIGPKYRRVDAGWMGRAKSHTSCKRDNFKLKREMSIQPGIWMKRNTATNWAKFIEIDGDCLDILTDKMYIPGWTLYLRRPVNKELSINRCIDGYGSSWSALVQFRSEH